MNKWRLRSAQNERRFYVGVPRLEVEVTKKFICNNGLNYDIQEYSY